MSNSSSTSNSKTNSLTNSLGEPTKTRAIYKVGNQKSNKTDLNTSINSNSSSKQNYTPRLLSNLKTEKHKDEIHFHIKDVKNLKSVATPHPAWWHIESVDESSNDFDSRKQQQPRRERLNSNETRFNGPESSNQTSLYEQQQFSAPKKQHSRNNYQPPTTFEEPISKIEKIRMIANGERAIRRSATTMHKVMSHGYQLERTKNFGEWNATQDPETYKYKSQAMSNRVMNQP